MKSIFFVLFFLLFVISSINATKSDSAKNDLSIIENEVETAFSSVKALIDRYFDGKVQKMARSFGASLRSIFSGGLSTLVFAASLAVGAITMLSFFESPISPLPVPPLPKPPVGRFPPEHPIWPPANAGRIGQESAPRPLYANPFQNWNYNRRNLLPSLVPPPPPPQSQLYSHISYRPYYQLNNNNNQTSLNDLNPYPNRRKISDESDETNRGKNTKHYTMRNGPLITYNSTNKVHFNTPRSFSAVNNQQNVINKRSDSDEEQTKPVIDKNNNNTKADGIKN